LCPTVTEPINFIHMQKNSADGGEGFVLLEYEIGNPVEKNLSTTEELKYRVYRAKRSPEFYQCYNWNVDLPKRQNSLHTMSSGDKFLFERRLAEYWQENERNYGNGNELWYFILEGNKCGLYQNEAEFVKIRDEFYQRNNPETFSYKACWFHNLTEAKEYIQLCREEEGKHFVWPSKLPVHWDQL
jgi:hypothetical protein